MSSFYFYQFINYGDLSRPTDNDDWHFLRRKIIESKSKNLLIQDICEILFRFKLKTLISVATKKYGLSISNELVRLGIPTLIEYGGGEKYINSVPEKGADIESLITSKDYSVLITSTLYDEGADIPELEVGLLCGGGKSERKIIQRTGRLLRKSASNKPKLIIDFLDKSSGITEYHSNRRLETIKNLGINQEYLAQNLNFFATLVHHLYS